MSNRFTERAQKEFICAECNKKVPETHRSGTGYLTCEDLNAKPLEIEYDAWYTMADNQEVFNTLNTIAMSFETFKEMNESTYGDSIRRYNFDENTFFKAEQIWAEREGLC